MSTPHDDRLRDADRPVGGADASRAAARDHGALPDDRGERIVDRSETVASAPTAERAPDRQPATDRREAERTATPRTATTERPGTDRRGTEPRGPEPQGTGQTGIGQTGTGQHGTVAPEPVKPGGSRTAGIWIALILGAIVLVLLLIFVIQNSTSTPFVYFTAHFNLPLGVAMLLAAVAGALVMALVGSVRMFQMSRTIRRFRKQQRAMRDIVER